MKTFFSAIAFLIPLCVWSQNERVLSKEIGIKDPQAFDQHMITVPGIGKDPRDMLDMQTIKPYMMPVRKVSSDGEELAYTIASALEYYVNLNENYKINLSPDYLSLNLLAGNKTITAKDALQLLVDEGTVSASIMPYGSRSIPPAVYATQKYTIQNFLYLFRDVTRSSQRSFETRKALMRGNPVIIEFNAHPRIKDLLYTTELDMSKKAEWVSKAVEVKYLDPALLMTPDNKDDETKSYPFIVVGYDDNLEAFEVLSSWGRVWGSSGYIWIKYEDFEEFATTGYVMVPQTEY